MGAFSIAFDITIVGALALPWVLLVIHLFFSEVEGLTNRLLHWLKDNKKAKAAAVAGVLLFALAYSLGSAVSRIAQDFLDDDDLHLQVFGYLFRVGATESGIRALVFCQNEEVVAPGPDDSAAGKRKTFRKIFKDDDPKCQFMGRWVVRQSNSIDDQPITEGWIDDQERLGGDIFRVHEGALLLLGIDANERLRQFHDQVMVLRGAAFNGMVAFSLCLFWWCRKRQYWLRFAVPFLYLVPGGIALRHHLGDRPIVSPPYMEFTLLVLAAAGMYLTRKLTNIEKESGVHSGRGELWFGYLVLAAFLIVAVFWGWWSGVVLAAVGVYLTWKLMNRSKEPENQEGQGEIHFGYLILAAFLTAAAFLGWWSTEVLYDQQVIYSYAALNKNAANAPSADATK